MARLASVPLLFVLAYLFFCLASLVQYAGYSGNIQEDFFPYSVKATDSLFSWSSVPVGFVHTFSLSPIAWGFSQLLGVASLGPCLLIIVATLVANSEDGRLVLRGVLAGGLVSACYSLLLHFSGAPIAAAFLPNTADGRLGTEAQPYYTHPNDFGIYYGFVVLIAATFVRLGWDKRLAYAAVVACGSALWLTYSRGTLIGALIGLYCIILLGAFALGPARASGASRVGVARLGALLLPGLGFLVYESGFFASLGTGRYATLLNPSSALSVPELQARIDVWSLAASLLWSRPWTGWGVEAMRIAAHGLPAHETFLDVGASVGYPGLACFVFSLIATAVVLVKALSAPDRVTRSLAVLGIAVTVAFAVDSLSESLLANTWSSPAWVIAGVPLGILLRTTSPSLASPGRRRGAAPLR